MKQKENIRNIVIFLIVIIILGIFIFKKPSESSITGKVTGKVVSEEAVFSENLNLQVNESGTYEWQIKNPGNIKSLKATGSASANGTARVFIEKNGTRYLLFDSTRQLFDVNIHVLPEYKKVLQGNEILIQNILFNLRGFGAGDVNVMYSIKDQRGNIIAAEEEMVFIETQAKFIRKLEIPPELKPGTYTAFVEAFVNGTTVGSGSDSFEVMAKEAYKYPPKLRQYFIGFAGLIAFVIIFVLITYRLGALKRKRRITELKERVPIERVQKLEKELKALEEGYKAKLISEESYKKEKARIENQLQKLRK